MPIKVDVEGDVTRLAVGSGRVAFEIENLSTSSPGDARWSFGVSAYAWRKGRAQRVAEKKGLATPSRRARELLARTSMQQAYEAQPRGDGTGPR
jgi:hypothetical protein